MKQVLNWTLGGFFRSFGRILCYLIIGGLLGFLLFNSGFKIPSFYKILGIEMVNASTIQPTSAKYMSLWCSDDTCDYTESSATNHSEWLNVNSSYSNPAGHIPGYYLMGLKFRFQLNQANYLILGNTYVVSVKFNLNPRIDNGLGTQYWYKILDVTYSDNTSEQIQGYSATCSIVNNDNYGMVCSFAITPSKAIKDFTFRINLPFEVGSIYNGIEGVNYKQYVIMTASDTTEAINQQTNELIINSNQNTQEIINNNNQNTQEIINAQQVCNNYTIDKNDIEKDNYYLNSNDQLVSSNNYGVTRYINIENVTTLNVITTGTYTSIFYTCDKTFIQTFNTNVLGSISVPNNACYMRLTIQKTDNKPKVSFTQCKNGNQALDDTLNDDDTDEYANDTIDFFEDYSISGENTLVGLITLPLDFISSISNQDFTDLCFTLKGKNICFPSGNIIWNRNHQNSWFGNNTITIEVFKTFFNLVVGGFLSYRLILAIIHTWHNILDPTISVVKVMKL